MEVERFALCVQQQATVRNKVIDVMQGRAKDLNGCADQIESASRRFQACKVKALDEAPFNSLARILQLLTLLSLDYERVRYRRRLDFGRVGDVIGHELSEQLAGAAISEVEGLRVIGRRDVLGIPGVEVLVPGDGNCLYHGIGRQIGESALQLRHRLSQFLLSDSYSGSGTNLNKLLESVLTDGSWGSTEEVEALSIMQRRPVLILDVTHGLRWLYDPASGNWSFVEVGALLPNNTLAIVFDTNHYNAYDLAHAPGKD